MRRTMKATKKVAKVTKKDEVITKTYLDETLNKRFAEQNESFKGMIKKEFDQFKTHFVTAMDSLLKDNAKTFGNEVDVVKSRLNVVEVKVKVLESQNQ
jgi:hypothetical protein